MYEINNYPIAYGLVALLALCIGSLINLIIYRLPLMIRSEWYECCKETFNLMQKPESKEKLNLFLPPSFCPHCKAAIKNRDKIPVLSYFLLKGRCRTCQGKIAWRYPLIEILTCLLSLFAVFSFGFSLKLLFILLFIWILIILFFIDLDEQLLPDSLTLGLLWLGLLANMNNYFTTLNDAVLSAAIGYLGLWIFIKLYYLLTTKIGMGNGDFKLFAALSAWFGSAKMLSILIVSSLSGAIIGFTFLTLTKRKKDSPIPFGPFLCLTGLIMLFVGQYF
ncbi:MAG: prepilin peptidase [Proteobacteria bacterium]|nr:prepilin peptidase [Pseudomonadota bacterium]